MNKECLLEQEATFQLMSGDASHDMHQNPFLPQKLVVVDFYGVRTSGMTGHL